MTDEYVLYTSGGYSKVYYNAVRNMIKKVQPLWTENKFLQYSAIVDLSAHVSFATIPGLPVLSEFKVADDEVIMYMPFYGVPVNKYVATFPPSEREKVVVNILLQLVDTCLHLFHNGVQHTDIKPSNVLVSNENVATLIDFNIVSSMQCQEDVLQWSNTIGTWNFCAPEIIWYSKPTCTSMVWSLGILLASLIYRFPLDASYKLNSKNVSSRQFWQQTYFDIQSHHPDHLPLRNGHKLIMSKQLQFIYTRCTDWNAEGRVTLSELRSMLSLLLHGSLPLPFYPQVISHEITPCKHANRIEYIEKLQDILVTLQKEHLLIRVISFWERLAAIREVSSEDMIACILLAWMMLGDYVFDEVDEVKHVCASYDVAYDVGQVSSAILRVAHSLGWMLWEKTSDVYLCEIGERGAVDRCIEHIMECNEPYSMEDLAIRI